MAVTQFILHRLAHHQPGSEAKMELRPQPLQVSYQHTELFQRLKQVFVLRSGKRFGGFGESGGEALLAPAVQAYLEGKQEFAALTARLMQAFKLALDGSEVECDVHLLFAHEQLIDQQNLYLFAVEHEAALAIDGTLELSDIRYLDTTRILFGWSLQLDGWHAEERSYFTLYYSRGQKPLAELIDPLLGFEEWIDVSADTQALLQVVEQFSAQQPEEQRFDTRRKVVEFCQEQSLRGEPVLIEELSRELNEEQPKAFEEYLAEVSDEPPTALITDRSSLKQLVRFSGRDKELSLSFSANLLDKGVSYDPVSGTLTITHVPPSLKAQLARARQRRE